MCSWRPTSIPAMQSKWPICAKRRKEQDLQIPQSGMAVCMDAGDSLTIHPANKTVVSNRLAYLALGKTYGVEGISYQGPTFKSMKLAADTVKVAFDNAVNGLTTLRQ